MFFYFLKKSLCLRFVKKKVFFCKYQLCIKVPALEKYQTFTNYLQLDFISLEHELFETFWEKVLFQKLLWDKVLSEKRYFLEKYFIKKVLFGKVLNILK